MLEQSILFTVFLIFFGAAIIATLALVARQALIIAYIVLGVLVGPSALGLVHDPDLIADIAQVGIIFLLFLLGLNLFPQKLIKLFREIAPITLLSSLVFALIGLGIGWLFGFALTENLVLGFISMFSSTIVGLKLLPTTVLHHRHRGELIVSVLLLQDLIAIAGLIIIDGIGAEGSSWFSLLTVIAMLPILVVIAWLGKQFVIVPLIARFDTIQEYIFLLTIGWCLGLAQLAHEMGLSYEIGAFTAGVALASHPIAMFISDALRHIRDFFLVIFFFALGAKMNIASAAEVVLPAVLLAGSMVIIKPVVFSKLFRWAGEDKNVSWECGVRLGQLSEFSLLLMLVAAEASLIGVKAQSLIQLATILTFILSTSWIVLRFPSPIALSAALRRN